MKAIYQILRITLQHNHASTSYLPYEDAEGYMFVSYEGAETWLNEHLSELGQTGELGMMVPEYNGTSWETSDKEVYKLFSKEDTYSICKVKLMGDTSGLVDYNEAESDLPF